MAEDLHDLKIRMSLVGANLASVNRRMDRYEERLTRIERRLELLESPCAVSAPGSAAAVPQLHRP